MHKNVQNGKSKKKRELGKKEWKKIKTMDKNFQERKQWKKNEGRKD